MWASSFILSEYDRLQTSTESTESDLASNVVLPRFSPDTILALCQEASEVLQKKPTLLNLTGEFYVIGDLHGNIRDLLRILVAARFQVTDVKLLFLGDYVDRGEFSIEVISLLLAMMIQFPDRVFLLRGNHEFAEVNEKYGFRDQLITEYSAPFSKLKENIVKSLNLNCHSEKNGSKPSGNKRCENRNGESKGGESKKFGDKNNEVKNDVKNGEMKNSEEKNGVCNQNLIGKGEIDAKTMQAFREMEKKFGVRSKCITMEEYYSKIKESPDEDSVNPDAGVNSFSSPAAATSCKGKINSDHSKLNEDMIKSAGYSLWRTFNDSVFSYLPLVAIINKELFCVHGGISHHVKSLSKIEEIQRPIYTYADNELIADLMWSDPTSKFSQYLLSTRG
ncbi:hypothetical protein TRFO_33324 [Tritrichomonas foetus]|uniref:Serine/threonine-protein phosphatase n=1 Tax=Tritrichomonas foetus TaxID=1144522 RepID=A0A1J4JRA1_9EUKA|nr:hypothetical protein TRFO_33324 [Tritrichomonas foetus]|eukprot:OHT00044.1 hypothetical protein TRFO_33324 [Tritrichomonas foetus]